MSVVKTYSSEVTVAGRPLTAEALDLSDYFPQDLIGSGMYCYLAASSDTTTAIFSSWANAPYMWDLRTDIEGTNASLAYMNSAGGTAHLMVVTETDTGLRLRDASVSSGAINFAFAPGAHEADMAALTGGGMVIAAELAGHIQVYRKTNTGTAISDFTIDTSANVDANPSVVALADGGFAVAWDRTVGTATQLWTAVYNADGSVRTAAAALDTTGTFNRMPDVKPLASGGFVIAYDNDAGVDSFGEHKTQVALEILDATGAPLRTILTPSWINEESSRPHVSQLPNGWLVVTADNDWGGSASDFDVNGFVVDPATGDILIGSPFPDVIGEWDGLQGGYNFNASVPGRSGRAGESLVVYVNDHDSASGMRTVTQQIAVTWTGDGADDTMIGDGYVDIMNGGDGNDYLSGGVHEDILNGGAGNDTLDGGADIDIMSGGAGNDVYYVEGADVIIETADGGVDTVRWYLDTYELPANVEHLILTGPGVQGRGNALDNRITGNINQNVLFGYGGDDRLDGGASNDRMEGGTGNDIYTVDDKHDKVIELVGEGIDQVQSWVTYKLTDNVENLKLLGTDHIIGIGNGLANNIVGNNGNNRLDGGAGNDTLEGGYGDDTYVVDSIGDVIVESNGRGFDTIEVGFDYVLAANIEGLTLTGTGNFKGTGNTVANTLVGNDGDNILDGLRGADTMQGGRGNDTYYVEDAGDLVVEAKGQGIDTVMSRLSLTLGDNVENLVLIEGGGRLSGTGNALANSITGNESANRIDGKAGLDFLTGGGGSDTFVFSTKLNAISNLDTLTDFVSRTDRIDLDHTFFAALPVGMLESTAFVQASAATTTSQRIVYDDSTGVISYDRDGSGAAASIAFAQVTIGQELSYKDFSIF